MKQITQPPLGLIPKWRHDELRLEALRAVIKRYEEAGYEPALEWVQEEQELSLIIQVYNNRKLLLAQGHQR